MELKFNVLYYPHMTVFLVFTRKEICTTGFRKRNHILELKSTHSL